MSDLFICIKLLKKDPVIKLTPIIKLIGSSMDSFLKRYTLLFWLLFWMPIIRKVNTLKLKMTLNNNFL